MMTNPSQQQLNNDACALLLQGHVERAWSMLRTSLQSVASFQDRTVLTFQDNPGNNEEENLLHLVKVDEFLFPEEFSLNNSFLVYRGVFLLSSTCDQATGLAVVLYNAAFTLHVAGMLRANHACLRKAMQFYTLAKSVWETSFKSPPKKKSSNVFQVALWTNLAHLHSHFLQVPQAQAFAEAILTILEREGAVVDEHESHTLCLILLHFQEGGSKTCAACA